jgi:hypothetical protein
MRNMNVVCCAVPQEDRRAQCGRRCRRPGCENLVWVEQGGEGRIHDYCRRTCARLHEAVRAPSQDSGQICQVEGCDRNVSVRPNGRAHDYCGRKCAMKHAHRQLGAGAHIAVT